MRGEQDDNQQAKQGRWQMSRAGILNFWFYEDEEFVLEDGRLVLRGTNGAGKSVTMQSFVPLVLDGDKRPHRLDPFGSKDRRIEYYLLGEKDEHSDRTGYLWLEFKHTRKGIYKTIGIGLRARKGVQQVGFWGFVLEDGRRINKDFWLHNRVLELEGEGKYPLDRKTLEERIGSGGQVVQEQGTYRDLVNRTLFGFYDRESYTDLLQLLVQLRSPKLSKDVKPTAIYDILVQSLPPLHEEELRPLSEVMEDMDQLADRLDELKLHESELEKLNRSYEQYNRFLVYQSGEKLLEARAAGNEVNRQVSALSKQLQTALADEAETESTHKANREKSIEIDSELELLGRSEAMEKQQELEQAKLALKETIQYVDQTQKRLTAALRARESAEIGFEKSRAEVAEQLDNQLQTLEQLEELAGGMEFGHHGVYHRYWSPEPPEDMDFQAAWRKDIEEHRLEIGKAITLAGKEKDAELRVVEYEKELGVIRSERDQAERISQEAEIAAEDSLLLWKEQMLEWKEHLQKLSLGEEAVRLMFEASAGLSVQQQSVEAVLRPVKAEADKQAQALIVQKLGQEQLIKQLGVELAQLEADKQAWQHSREPEPKRSEERVRTRSTYGAGQGAPLYELCEFLPHLTPQQQASIELTLLGSGLLDGWVRPDGTIGQLKERDEDVWINPAPIEWGYTLADVLKPMPAAESGISERLVGEVLRSFAWGEAFEASIEHQSGHQSGSESSQAIIIGSDYYQYGAVIGKLDGRTERKAQYIGKEARRQFKLAEIERLQQAIEVAQQQLARIAAVVEGIQLVIAEIEAEVQRFPLNEERHEALLLAWRAQYDAMARFDMFMKQETRMAGELRSKQEQWSQLKQALIVATSGWMRLKSHGALSEALEVVSDYQAELSQLVSDWRVYKQAVKERERYKEEAAMHAEQLEIEEEQRDVLLDKQYSLRIKVEQLHKLMDELGIADLHERISQLKNQRSEIGRVQLQLVEEQKKLAGHLGALRERHLQLAEQESAAMERFGRCERAYLDELALQLIPELLTAAPKTELDGEVDDGSVTPIGRDSLLRQCKELVSALEATMSRSNKERLGSILQDHYNATKHLLAEYVLEAEISEQGRITMLSMRDRTRPQKPGALLAEMNDLLLEQQNLLSEKDRELFEEIILRSVGKAIRGRIQRAELWMKTMNRLMAERDTSSGLKLQLQWLPKAANTEQELNSDELVSLLRRDAHLLHDDEVELLIKHFRSRIQWAKQGATEERETLRKHLYDMLDYRSWFQFSLRYKKGEEGQYRELTDSRFNVLSGGEKAMSMYIPLFAATYSRYEDAGPDAPKIISLDEAFAGVDDENIRDLFGLLTQMDFDYMMTSQVLWGCYDTVPKLGICEIYRPKDADYVTLFRYRWNGKTREYVGTEDHEDHEDHVTALDDDIATDVVSVVDEDIDRDRMSER